MNQCKNIVVISKKFNHILFISDQCNIDLFNIYSRFNLFIYSFATKLTNIPRCRLTIELMGQEKGDSILYWDILLIVRV